MRLYVILIFALMVTGCSEDLDDKVNDLEKLTSTGDYWIVKQGDYYVERQYKVGLIFGYGNNGLVCNDMIAVYRRAHPNDKVRCVAEK